METIPVSALIEEAVAGSALTKKLSGSVRSFDRLFAEENLVQLESEHSGVFAFLAFHPTADKAVAGYVRSGTLGSDSGPRILVLFTLDTDTRPAARSIAVDWGEIDPTVHPAYEAVRLLFTPQAPPPAPGVVFVSRFSGAGDAVYAHLAGLVDEAAVRERLRVLFSLADEALGARGDRSGFTDAFAVALRASRLPYSRSGRASLREWLVRTYQFAIDRGADIVAVLGPLAG